MAAPYVPALLKDNPALIQSLHKRLGDTYTEMHLIEQQIAELTGRKAFNGDNALEEYKALLDSGAHFAQRFGLSPGIELTPEQMSNLTEDMVWYVNQDITLPDGSVQTVSVPKVYLRSKKGDIDGRYTYISADHVVDNSETGHFNNDAIVNGRQTVQFNNADVTNRGTIRGGKVYSSNTGTFDNTGGRVEGRTAIDIEAENIIGQSTTKQTGYQAGIGTHSTTEIDRQSSFILDNGGEGESGYLNLHARNTNTQNASAIINRNKDSITVVSGDKGVSFGTVSTEETHNHDADARHYNHESTRTDNGTVIQGEGNVTVSSIGGKVDATAVQIDSANGKTTVYGAKGVDIKNGWQDDSLAYATTGKSRKLLNTTRTVDQHDESSHQAIASNVTGKTVDIIAGDIQQDDTVTGNADITLTGSNVVSDHGTLLQAGHDITLNSAENTYSIDHQHQSTKSGLMGAGIGFMIGTREQGAENSQKSTIQSASMVGTLDGNVVIDAGNHYQQTGSIVHAGRASGPLSKDEWLALPEDERMRAGNLIINAKSADIDYATNQHSLDSKQHFEQSGLTVSLGGAAISAIQTVGQSIDSIGKGNGRIDAMASANAAWNAYQGAQAVNQAVSDPKNSNAINISITVGSQKSESESHQKFQGIQASQATGDGAVLVNIKGKGEGSTLNVTGSDIGGSAYTGFDVEGKKTFRAAELESSQHSSNKSSGFNVGVAIDIGQNGWSAGLTGGGNFGKGYSDGKGKTYRLSHAGTYTGHTDLGDGDTTLIGAQVIGKGVTGNVKDLVIISPQETETYTSKQLNASAQATVGYGASFSGELSESDINASHKSINAESGQRSTLDGANLDNSKAGQLGQSISTNNHDANASQAMLGGQSGIFAGDDGFQVTAKTTTLLGGIVTSTAKAEAEGKNSFVTDRIVIKDLENRSEYEADGFSIGGGFSVSGNSLGQGESNDNEHLTDVGGKGGLSKSVGYGQAGDNRSSTTRAGIATANLIVTDDAGQRALTGQSAAEAAKAAQIGITTETARANSGALVNNFDAEKVQQDVNRQVAVTKEFDKTRQGIRNEIRSSQVQLQDELKQAQQNGDLAKAAELQQRINNLDNLGLVVDSVGAGLYSPSTSAVGTGAHMLSPYVTKAWGDYMKKSGQENTPLHYLGHVAIAAADAGASGNDPLSAGLSAGAAEAIAPIYSKLATGTADISKLTAEQQNNIATLGGIIGTGIGATTGNPTDIAMSNVAGARAVEDNFLGTLSQSRLDEAKENLLDKTKRATLEDYRDIVELNRRDQVNDYLLNKWQAGGELTDDEYKKLNIALNTYYFEEKQQYGAEKAKQSLNDLINAAPGYRASNYDYPFAGTQAQQQAWKDKHRDQITFWSLNQSKAGIEAGKIDAVARGQLQASHTMQELGSLGLPAVELTTGPLGQIARGTSAVNSGALIIDGVKQIDHGNREGFVNVLVGGANLTGTVGAFGISRNYSKASGKNTVSASKAESPKADAQAIKNNIEASRKARESSNFGDYIIPTGRQTIDPTRTSFSQATVSYQKRGRTYNYDTIVADMKTKKGWIGDPIDVVNMPDGAPTSMDNTRVLAAREAGVKVEANVHNYSDPLTPEQAERFALNKQKPKNWGEAIEIRVKKQESQKGVPKGWSERFPNGSIYDPEVIKND